MKKEIILQHSQLIAEYQTMFTLLMEKQKELIEKGVWDVESNEPTFLWRCSQCIRPFSLVQSLSAPGIEAENELMAADFLLSELHKQAHESFQTTGLSIQILDKKFDFCISGSVSIESVLKLYAARLSNLENQTK